MSWDAFQRQVLAELGHSVYVARGESSPPRTDPAAAAPVQAGAATDHPLLARIARAAGLAPAQLRRLAPDVAERAAGLDAAAKRALWPRLRSLRRDAR